MSGKNKNHNRIIFLTTLSVYLGLVLVGATPQVLAQSQPVIRKNDNPVRYQWTALNEKPLNEFKSKIVQLIQNGQLDFAKPFEFKIVSDVKGDKIQNAKFELISGELFIADLQKEFFRAISESGLLSYLYVRDAKEISFGVKNDGESAAINLVLKIDNPGSVRVASSAYNMLIQVARFQQHKTKLLLENAKVSFENNQVFIVTRLPRAAIDEFLANRAR